MILVYSPKCTPLETERTYSWSTIDNKPETNATTNCISALIDVNGNKKPNKIGKDVCTWNSLYASRDFGQSYTPLALAAGTRYGRSDITPYTALSSVQFAKTYRTSRGWFDSNMACEQLWRKAGWGSPDQIICIDNGDSTNTNKSMGQDDDAGASTILNDGYYRLLQRFPLPAF